MWKRAWFWIAAVGLLLASAGSAGGEGVQQVMVTNFPALQRVEGDVRVRQPVALAAQFVRRKATVLPSRPTQARELTDGGEFDAQNFSRIVVSLAGAATSRIVAPGSVGALLVPDDPDILSTWQETGVAQLAVRIEAAVTPSEAGLFEAAPVEFRPAFPSYRVFFYDTLQGSVELRFHAYLTSS